MLACHHYLGNFYFFFCFCTFLWLAVILIFSILAYLQICGYIFLPFICASLFIFLCYKFCFRLLYVVPMATARLEIDKYDGKSYFSIWRRKTSVVLLQTKVLPIVSKPKYISLILRKALQKS